MTWIVLLAALVLAVVLFAAAVWILIGWTPAEAHPSDRLPRLRQVLREDD
jgi:hypothetical protein